MADQVMFVMRSKLYNSLKLLGKIPKELAEWEFTEVGGVCLWQEEYMRWHRDPLSKDVESLLSELEDDESPYLKLTQKLYGLEPYECFGLMIMPDESDIECRGVPWDLGLDSVRKLEFTGVDSDHPQKPSFDFPTAMIHLQTGGAVMRPCWGGYWTWDEKEQDIQVHRPDGRTWTMAGWHYAVGSEVFYEHMCAQDFTVVQDVEKTQHHRNCPRKAREAS